MDAAERLCKSAQPQSSGSFSIPQIASVTFSTGKIAGKVSCYHGDGDYLNKNIVFEAIFQYSNPEVQANFCT